MAQPNHAPLKPTMGAGAESFRLLLNVIPRDGVLTPRPRIKCTQLGICPTDYSPNSTYINIPSFTGTDNDATLNSYTEMNTAAEIDIVEGIDIELVNSRLVCLYLRRSSDMTTDDPPVRVTDVKFGYSWHPVTETLYGPPSIAGSFETVSKTDLGASLEHGRHAYTVARYWDRRIHKVLDSFIIAGKNVGAGRLVSGSSVVSVKTLHPDDTPINNDGEIVLFDGTPMKMMGAPLDVTRVDDSDTNKAVIPRVDPFSTIYVKHAPIGAFAHTDRLGQTIWYGFDTRAYELDSALPADQVLISILQKDIDSTGTFIKAQPYDVWYSEPGIPQSLPIAGLVPCLNSSVSDRVVGLAEFQGGTAVVTDESVQFLQGVGADWNGLTKQIVYRGIGSTSRHSVKAVGNGVVFANNEGLHYLEPNAQLARLDQFNELFGRGVEISRGPYDELQGSSSADYGTEMGYCNTADVVPWRTYAVDKHKLDRAVGAVWDDLYLFFCTHEGADAGDDNRLVLVWNWQQNMAAVWMLPKDMGVRGWAYDGNVSTPYVMTRGGVARFELTGGRDQMWINAYASSNAHAINPVEPNVPIVGQTNHYPQTTDAFVAADIVVNHTANVDDSLDNDYKMRIQMWQHISELSVGQKTRDTNTLNNSDSTALQNLYQGTFSSWRKSSTAVAGTNHQQKTAEGNDDSSHRVPQDIIRASIGRSGGHALSHKAQFSTLQPATIYSTQVGVIAAAPRGRRS